MRNKSFTTLIAVAFVLFFIFLKVGYVSAAADLDTGINELAQQISKNMTETGKKKIAIIEFSDLDGNITAFGQFLAEELITKLFMISPGQFEVVERRQLMKVLKEQRLTMSGLLDAKAMESVGKILGIEAIVTGSITDLGNTVKVNARLIGVDTAKVFAVAATSIPKVGTVARLMEKEAAPAQIYTSTTGETGNRGSSIRSNARRKGSAPFFQNSFLRVTLQSISKSKDKKKINLVLTLENISKEDILIAMQSKADRNRYLSTSLLDDQGVQWTPARLNGLEFIIVGTGYYRKKENYSVFNPGTENTIVMVFKSDEESDGNIFNFSADCYRYTNKSVSKFSIGISDMRITQ